MILVDLLLYEIINLAGWKRGDTAFPYITLKEVVNLAGAAAKLADLCFDAGKGYKRFDALTQHRKEKMCNM